jgi:hypothetical protein
VFEHVTALLCSFHHQLQPLANFHLAGELAEGRWPQRNFKGGIWFWWFHERWSHE